MAARVLASQCRSGLYNLDIIASACCPLKEFLLKFIRDRRRWLQWLFEAKERHGISILNYMMASNHIHLPREAGFRKLNILAYFAGSNTILNVSCGEDLCRTGLKASSR